jgi:SAM-dependent methyltransferase
LPGLPFPSWLDAPLPEEKRAIHGLLVRGWIAVRRRAHVEAPEIVIGATRLPTEVETRPEVRPGRLHRQIVGFQRQVALDPDFASVPWQLEVRVDGRTFCGELGIEVDLDGLARLADAKTRKLPRIEPLLRCPKIQPQPEPAAACGGLLGRSGEELQCERCGATYPATSEHFDFLSDELRSTSGVEATDNVSSLGYDPLAQELIERFSGGLVLDAGSGLKRPKYEHVVNLEVVAYPSTDVLAAGESLPFADGTFDGALSLAVLEHVRDPWRCAAELARVVRPGGQIYVAVPFLQPYHGYPHHYYNMTLTGLGNLFDDWFTIDRSGTPPYGWPVWTLTWFLNRYVAGLPPAVARRFKEMKVADLLSEGTEYLAADFVTNLDEDVVTELASMNFLIGTRR